ncbi:helix-turn-helix transcriptional regulator [Clostridium sp. HBUAS56017]|uniref:helix-turn-helix domain-containing protein n=1 Tax=Clostridium sp. HBUAS56017 TaxID=2571128 RepID=UPI0011787AC1|nr:helix-turn-helix transcriptional regulator [Clostridium sp. HBUAS56017]
MNLGEKIKQLRKSNKMTQIELAKKANISRSYLADIERNRYNASLDTLNAISNALNVSINEFFEDKPKIESPKNYYFEQYLRILGFEIIFHESEGYIILDTPNLQYEISASDLEDLQNSTDLFIKFKIAEITNKSKKYTKYTKNNKDYLIAQAAHNDFEDDEEQKRLMKEDLNEL